MTAEEKDALLAEYHPDYKGVGFTTIKVGPNKGEKAPIELEEMIEGRSRVLDLNVESGQDRLQCGRAGHRRRRRGLFGCD